MFWNGVLISDDYYDGEKITLPYGLTIYPRERRATYIKDYVIHDVDLKTALKIMRIYEMLQTGPTKNSKSALDKVLSKINIYSVHTSIFLLPIEEHLHPTIRIGHTYIHAPTGTDFVYTSPYLSYSTKTKNNSYLLLNDEQKKQYFVHFWTHKHKYQKHVAEYMKIPGTGFYLMREEILGSVPVLAIAKGPVTATLFQTIDNENITSEFLDIVSSIKVTAEHTQPGEVTYFFQLDKTSPKPKIKIRKNTIISGDSDAFWDDPIIDGWKNFITYTDAVSLLRKNGLHFVYRHHKKVLEVYDNAGKQIFHKHVDIGFLYALKESKERSILSLLTLV